VVSRIEPIQYSHGGIYLLGVQIDASINPGNSGGPALLESSENQVAGVAFQALVGADNIGMF
jgi:S1-C subfamily serine protease